MHLVQPILFLILSFCGISLFIHNILKIKRNILLNPTKLPSDRPLKRGKTMLKIALGQGKMMRKPIAGFLHLLVYIGFIIVNLDLIEIFTDGIFNTHRAFGSLLPTPIYNLVTASLDLSAFIVIIAVIFFFCRRNITKVPRLNSKDLLGWPKLDGNLILIIEFILMSALLCLNAADIVLTQRENKINIGFFPISNFLLANNFSNFSSNSLFFIRISCWWIHYAGILFFLNYLYFSKHLHILFAFPNTYYSNLDPEGTLNNMPSVTQEVKLMLNLSSAAPLENETSALPKFGVSDAIDLSRIQLLNAYSCTECGRCTANCPANLTGKKLSPRKIMMNVRDRIEEIGRNIDKYGAFKEDGKQLLGDYITPEELWACTSCNACVESCPILINPLSVIIDMRRYLVMEQSKAPAGLNTMMLNIENNSAPWPFSRDDRTLWTQEKES